MEQVRLIMLAEDEALIALTAQDALEEAGFGVHHVLTAEEGRRALDARQEDFAALVTDIKLSGPMDGWALARHARELMSHIPVVYTSGDSAHEHTVHGVPESVMLQKPFALAQLITAVSTLLNAMPPSAKPAPSVG